MIAVISLLAVVVLSLLVTRIATMALTLTGLSQQSARFQARSAFTGVGFTTSESERVVQHPVRRRILMVLMLLGNAGVVTAVASLMLAFLDMNASTPVWMRFGLLGFGLALLWLVSASAWVDRWLSRLITWALERWTDLDVRDYASLLRLGGDYAVAELGVGRQDGWLVGRTLTSLRLREEGVICLAIERASGSFLGAPQADTEIEMGDVLLLYGRSDAVSALSDRREGYGGWIEHREAVERHDETVREEKEVDANRSQAKAEDR